MEGEARETQRDGENETVRDTERETVKGSETKSSANVCNCVIMVFFQKLRDLNNISFGDLNNSPQAATYTDNVL